MLNKKMLIAMGLTPLCVVPFATISCSSSNKQIQTNKEIFDVNVSYPLNALLTSKELPNKINVYQAEFNVNATTRVDKIKNNLTVHSLQFDFQTVLQDFYEAYEAQNSQYEIEIESIRVKSKNANNSFILTIKYELESETRDNEEIFTKDIEWTPKMKLISKEEIEKIKQDIINLSTKPNSGFDLEDIKELFLGERYDDDFDDKGIFDKIAIINKDYADLVYLLAYEISIDDIFSQLNLPKKMLQLKLNSWFHHYP